MNGNAQSDGGAELASSEEASAGSRKALERTAAPYSSTIDGEPPPLGRTWLDELPRWMATLNPGRTRREYEKAVSYFFLTPGVPSELHALTFDLLLAYRGALALRAAPLERGAAYTAPARSRRAPELGSPARHALPGPDDHAEQARGEDGNSASEARSLAPATVNIRLTALRQFLVHCSMMELLSGLMPDRIRMALRRLQIDRRRPYQILAESEWEEFLAAAALPARPRPAVSAGEERPDEPSSLDKTQGRGRRGPWGTPRAARMQATLERSAEGSEDPTGKSNTVLETGSPRVVRSRAGLTGERTAQRDHALLALALATGLRAIEISLLDVGDLTREWHEGQEEWWLVLPDAKTKGQHGGRTLPLAPPLVEVLLSYIGSIGRRLDRAADRSTPLFLSSRGTSDANHPDEAGTRLSAGQIGRIVDRVEAQWARRRDASAGETRAISPHALRHSTAMALLEGSADGVRPPASVEHVRGWLGHFDIRTTQGYLAHLDARHHRRSLKILPPVATSSHATDAVGANPDAGVAEDAPDGASGGTDI